jgi:methylphosphotriester-DNA--protein-cysteine methyltransferase
MFFYKYVVQSCRVSHRDEHLMKQFFSCVRITRVLCVANRRSFLETH